jgi:hypothetical protein
VERKIHALPQMRAGKSLSTGADYADWHLPESEGAMSGVKSVPEKKAPRRFASPYIQYVVDFARWILACFQHAICYDEKWPAETPFEWAMGSMSRFLRTGKWREESALLYSHLDPDGAPPRTIVWERSTWPRFPRFRTDPVRPT